MATEGSIKVTMVRSGISTKPKHRATLRALGLRGVGQVNVLPDRREIRGMIARVPHLVTVEQTNEQPTPSPRRSAERMAKSAARAALSEVEN
jgi:large subunit ribosomal protein L30